LQGLLEFGLYIRRSLAGLRFAGLASGSPRNPIDKATPLASLHSRNENPFLKCPNLNLLGRAKRMSMELPTLAEIEAKVRERGKKLGVDIDFRQSNLEGELVGWIRKPKRSLM